MELILEYDRDVNKIYEKCGHAETHIYLAELQTAKTEAAPSFFDQ